MRLLFLLTCLLFYPEISIGIVVTNILNRLAYEGIVAGQVALFYPGAEQIAENPAEIFMACEGEEASGVSEHADERADQADAGERLQLLQHALLLVMEPPA